MTGGTLRAAIAGAVCLVALPLSGAVLVPATLRIPKKAEHPRGAPQDAALFSHRRHGGAPCYVCHPSLFPQAPLGFTHADMAQRRFCGGCHDGGAAPAVQTYACVRCHASR